ncbi:DUF1501 domain-containing protein [Acidiferrimicrobium sp. IK]|uniref:DUF1501 domain-containing protein n=1 Tax=Acidiferrimicrobium sp. IK TaxID=2871700 RepID=UPI0021CB55A2|nr:DUF1501 domain-containing protein [Acidiferrimicrobium sp. IK]MCU4184912.1 DUF1501 domain-containing protein [Acidiferrimicrobium sp. IK]
MTTPIGPTGQPGPPPGDPDRGTVGWEPDAGLVPAEQDPSGVGREPRRAGLLSRRQVLTGAGALAGAGLLGAGLAFRPWATSPAAGSGRPAGAVRSTSGVAVLVTLYGGNDGLNTVVPAADPAYQSGRPDLGYKPNEVLPLAEGLGLNPKMPLMKKRWDSHQLAIVRGVGYPDPSLSHFQSMDIWQTAEASGAGSGWLGRWLDATGTDPMRAISVGATLPPALRGDRQAATAITSGTITLPGRAPMIAGFTACAQPGPDRGPLAAAVSGSAADLLRVRSSLASLTGRTSTSGTAPAGTTPSGPGTSGTGAAARATAAASGGALADQLATVAALINAGAPTRVYQVSLSSFDTHADEKAGQERLLAELDGALDSFLNAVGTGPRAADVVVFTVSEFGRRVAQNASGGTDHGTASALLVAGHGVKGGFYGDQPSLTALDTSGNLRYSVDFRSVYATILAGVLGVDPTGVLGAKFPALGFV